MSTSDSRGKYDWKKYYKNDGKNCTHRVRQGGYGKIAFDIIVDWNKLHSGYF
jgi:hypothetical protein